MCNWLKILLVLFGILLSTTQVFAQIGYQEPSYNNHDYVNSLYLEFGGAGTYLTLNYDLTIDESSVIRLGVAPTFQLNPEDQNPLKNNGETIFIGVVSFSRLLSPKKSPHNIETGIGFALGNIQTNEQPGAPSLFLNFGYRFLSKKEKGGVIRASFTPFINNGKIHPWFGVSFGYSFKNWTDD
tara:strand:+ start:25233 stop:25781 length:549 start_codon:yes stop_codon:yes gene_type:complete